MQSALPVSNDDELQLRDSVLPETAKDFTLTKCVQ